QGNAAEVEPQRRLLRVLPQPVHELEHVALVEPRELDPPAPGHAPGDTEPCRECAVAAQGQDHAGDRLRSIEGDLVELVAEEEARNAPGRGQVTVRGGGGIAHFRAVVPSRIALPPAAWK